MYLESQLQLVTSSFALCHVICLTSPPPSGIRNTSALPYCRPVNAIHLPSGETFALVSYPCMAVSREALPSLREAFQRSPSKLKITDCPSGVREGFDKKYAVEF